MLFGCSSNDKDSGSKSNGDSKAAKDDYKIQTFGASTYTIEEALDKYIPPKKRKRRITYDHLMKAAKKAIKSLDFESAILIADKGIKMAPKRYEAYYYRGEGLYNSLHGSSDAALKDFLKAAKLGDLRGGSYEYAARIYCDRKMLPEAIEAISKGIEVNPSERDFYKYRAALYSQMKDYKNARKDYDMHVSVAPDKMGGYIERARFLYSMGEFESALKDYSTVISLTESSLPNPGKRTYALRLRAGLYAELKEYKKAQTDYDELIKMHPTADELYNLRGEAYKGSKDYQKAIDDFTRSIELAPEFSARQAYESRSAVYKLIGKDKLAQADLEMAKRIKNAPAEKSLFKMEQ